VKHVRQDIVRRGRMVRRIAALCLSVVGGSAVIVAGVVPAGLSAAGASQQTTVTITLTPQGCSPKPTSVKAGAVQFNVSNKNAGAVSEAELRSSDLSHILGEQENLTPGLSGGFSLNMQPGHYVVNCPGAAQQHAKFTVTGKGAKLSKATAAAFASAATDYAAYVNQNVAALVATTQAMCSQIDAGNLSGAELAYPQARIYYERIEPVAEIWGSLDTAIDGRIDNPVTNPANLTGFHRIEEIMWSDNTLTGAATFCSGLVANEQELQKLVSTAQYNPTTMVSGATDLINEAATSKITGEEERYSNTDLIVFQANVDGAMEVVSLLTPYLQKNDPGALSQITKQKAAVEAALAKYTATPGYDNTGYVEYSTVLDPQRKVLSARVQALAEALSKVSGVVS
jgi:iron uptake system component EfeO